MMFLREPYRIPLDFVVKIYNSSQVIYTLVILLAYIAASCIPFLIRQIKKKVQEKKKTEERIRG
jgi:hypothetical protein